MKLSEAIRLGAALGPQIYGNYRNPYNDGTCAIGAAMLAIGSKTPEGWTDEEACYLCWPILSMRVLFPLGDYRPYDLWDAITELNDEYRWTREQIADWVETIEALAPSQVGSSSTVGRPDTSEPIHA